MVRIARKVQLSEPQKRELTSIAQSRALPAGYVFRAKLILMLSEGASFATIRERLGDNEPNDHPLEGTLLVSGHGRIRYQSSRPAAV